MFWWLFGSNFLFFLLKFIGIYLGLGCLFSIRMNMINILFVLFVSGLGYYILVDCLCKIRI